MGGGLWNFLECRKEWYKKYHVVNLAILTFSLTLLLFREMNSVLAFVSDAYCVYGSEASASEGEHPFVCRSVHLSVSAPFSSRSWGWPGPSLFSCLWDKLLAASLSPCLSRPLSQLAPKPQQPPRPSLLTSCPKRGGRLLSLASSLVVSLCCVQLPPSHCISSFDVLLTICLSIFHAEPNLTAACRECLYVVAQPKKILSCLINYHLKVTSPPLLRK